MGIFLPLVIISITSILSAWLLRHLRLRNSLKGMNQSRNYPIIGNALVTKPDPEGFVNQLMGICILYPNNPRMFLLWLGPIPIVMLYSAELIEAVLSTGKHLDKGFAYKLMEPWLGLSLLTSSKDRWRPKRKLLTPTFHYDILKDFVPVFNEQSVILIEKISKLPEGHPIDILAIVTLCTLDIICETSMGKSVNAQLQENNEYVWAVHTINTLIQDRMRNPLTWNEAIFNQFGQGKTHQKCLEILHTFTRKVIDERHRELEACGWKFNKRLAFLDLLLDMARNGQMDPADIQAEVDTFMFEGHDTTSSGLTWALHLIGNSPDVQRKIQAELDDVLGDDEDVTTEHLTRLKYLECCIKESLRVCPPVPIIMRQLGADQEVGGVTLPAGCNLLINQYMVHRDPKHWPDAERFDPDRYASTITLFILHFFYGFLPENAVKRHSFSFVPFSAGGRNCIGQRFAILEEKVVLAHILRRFNVESVQKRHEVHTRVEIIMRPTEPIHIKFSPRRLSATKNLVLQGK